MSEPECVTIGPCRLFRGDARDILPTLDAGSVDAIVTDPPYGLEFMGKDWDKLGWQAGGGFSKPGIGDRPTAWASFSSTSRFGAANPTCGDCGGRLRGAKKCGCETPAWKPIGKRRNAENEGLPDDVTGAGYGRQLSAMQEWHRTWAEECLRLLKPGGHLLAFGGTRTYHRLACAVEDAGFEIRDQIGWMYGSGFPKSHNLDGEWDGWGTALKPAWEPIVVARKPLSGTVAANVQRYGTGAINVDATRISPSCPPPDAAAYARLSRLCLLLDTGDGSPELARRVVLHIASALRACSSDGTYRQRSEAGPGDTSPWGDPADGRLLSRLLPSVGWCDLRWSEALSSPADCLACRRSCDERLRIAAKSAREGETSLGDALERICSSRPGPECSRCCQRNGHPSSSGDDPLLRPLAVLLLRGALNKYSRVAGDDSLRIRNNTKTIGGNGKYGGGEAVGTASSPLGRWPANVIHDGSEEVLEAFAAFGESKSSGTTRARTTPKMLGVMNDDGWKPTGTVEIGHGDSGTAARFFYCAKASKADRNYGLPDGAKNEHPTVKPLALARYLCRLVTPPGGTVLTPFLGSGSEIVGAVLEGFRGVGIEKDAESFETAACRIRRAVSDSRSLLPLEVA